MNPGNIAALAAGAGFSGNDLDVAVAIALAESGGDANKYNPESAAPGGTPPSKGSYGLWQIYLKKHPQFEGSNLLDPMTNAHAAFDVYSREGFNAWTTYKTKRYLAFLPTDLPSSPYQGPGSPVFQPPLTIDAATGLRVADMPSEVVAAGFSPPSELSFGKALLWGAIGLFALWIFEEVV